MSKLDTGLWRDMMQYLRHKHAPICRQWFEQLEPVGWDSGCLEVKTATTVQQNYLQNRCVEQFTEAAQAVTGKLVAVRFVSDAEARAITGDFRRGLRDDAGGDDVPTNGQNRTPVSSTIGDQIVISPDYSFENFVTGPTNRLAFAAAVAVANQPGTAYNPLFIHGGVGLGKTHLLQAISQKLLHDRAGMRICYIPCDVFMNDFLECVRAGKMAEFRHRYRHVDMLVIDDIHFLAKRDQSQEEFFHTFNELYQTNKQIVLSSDSPPSEIPMLEERLVSRFQWGLVASVSKPSFETRVAILQAKLQLRGMTLPDDVLSYIATKVDSNARELEGALTTVQGHAALQGLDITLEVAKNALGEPTEGRISQVTLHNIIDAVTQFYNVKLSDLQSRRRHKSVTEPRQVCMWLARKRTRFSLEEIGAFFGGRDHTTVMHSIKTVSDRKTIDATFARQLDQIEDLILARQ
jgi:chromosomal replication initiator protein